MSLVPIGKVMVMTGRFRLPPFSSFFPLSLSPAPRTQSSPTTARMGRIKFDLYAPKSRAIAAASGWRAEGGKKRKDADSNSPVRSGHRKPIQLIGFHQQLPSRRQRDRDNPFCGRAFLGSSIVYQHPHVHITSRGSNAARINS